MVVLSFEKKGWLDPDRKRIIHTAVFFKNNKLKTRRDLNP